jgi:hypothetical protein
MTAWPTVWHPRSSGLILNNFLLVQTFEVTRLYNISRITESLVVKLHASLTRFNVTMLKAVRENVVRHTDIFFEMDEPRFYNLLKLRWTRHLIIR